MIKLICDLNITLRGHNAGYVQYIVNHIKIKNDDQIFFLFNKSARQIINISNSAVNSNNFYFSEGDFENNSFAEKFKFKEWKVITQYADQLKIDDLFIMELTRFEVQIGRSKVPYNICGIEFRPSHRIRASNGKLSIRLEAWLQKYKRRFFESILLRSKSLKKIYILNDPSGVTSLNKTYNTDVFKHVADPIYDYSELDAVSKAHLTPVSEDKVVFIIFGSLDWRKNIKNIFDGFTLTDKSIHSNICLLIVGKIPPSFMDEFKILVQKLTSFCPGIELIVVDNFVSDSEMEHYFSISDVSLVIYQKFYGSSGLMGRAAKYNLISIVPNVGLMAEMCIDYKLGYLCDPNSPEDIESKILLAYNDIRKNKRIDGKEFYNSHSPHRFLELLDF